MSDRDEKIIKETESWLGTPWMHGQALKGVGADCVRFIVAVAKNLDWIPQNYLPPPYNQDWALHNEISILEQELQKFGHKVEPPYIVGDIITFIYGKCASHAGIYVGDNQMIHSYRWHGVAKAAIAHYADKFHSAWRVNR